MKIMLHKDFKTLQDETEKDFQETIFHNNKKGSVLRLITNSFLSKLANLYQYVDYMQKLTFLSSSEDTSLDEIGKLVNCKRMGDSNEVYKERIAKETTRMERANRTSIEEAARVQDVQDVQVVKNAFGLGTFAVFPLGRHAQFPEVVLRDMESEINKVISEGTYFEVINPTLLPVEIYIVIVENEDTNIEYVPLTTNTVESRVSNYLKSRKIGETFSFQDLKGYLFEDDDVRKNVKDFLLISLLINGEECSEKVFKTGWNQRLIESESDLAIRVQGPKEML